MVKRYKGGLMGSTEAVTSISDARGMWGTVQATQARYSGNWPALLTTETPGSGSGAGFANAFMTVSNVAVTDSNYTVLNDTPNISTAGGFIKITGRGFVSGCVVYVGGTPATTTTFISSTEVRAQIPAATSNTLMVYVVNPDGSTGIKLNSLVFSGTPTWTTGATLTSQVTDVVFSISFAATSDSAVTYLLNTGSTLPPGTSLFANGLFTGTVTGLSSDTTYSFSVLANDAENQDTARTFSVTFGVGDSGFPLTSSIFNSDGNTWVRDASVNNAALTVGNDTRPTAFSPYNSNWSGLFNGSTDYLVVAGNANLAFGTSDFTIECFFYLNDAVTSGFIYDARTGTNQAVPCILTSAGTVQYYVSGSNRIISGTIVANRWYHLVVSRVSGNTRMFLDGVQTGSTYVDATTYLNNASRPVIGTNGDNVSFFCNGYVSNLRVLNGTGTTSPTVPTAPLTAIANTQLLTLQDTRFKDNSTNAYAITVTGATAIKSFGPLTETDATTGSAYFDGVGDHLIITDNAGMELGAGDFCVECWIYPTSVSGTAVVIDKRSGGYAPLLLWRSSSTLQIYMSLNGSSWGLASAVTVGTLVINQWYHVAVFRVGTSLYTSFNGVVSLVTASGSGTLVNNATNWYIGTETNGSTNPWTGYIADMRFVVGSGVYTSANFTPATSSLSSVANTQLLTLQSRTGENNHRFIDESGLKHVITRNGDTYQGSFSPHSPAGWSAYFDGTGDYLTVTGSSNLAFGTNDFTIEMFVWFNGTGQVNFYDQRPQSTNGLYPTIYVTGSAFIAYRTNSADRITSDAVITANRWYHLVVSRVSSVTRMFIDGVQQTQTYSDTNSYLNGTTRPVIGSGGDGQSVVLNGYISNLRVLNGTGYTTVTVPTVPLTAIANTQLLTLQNNRFVDNSTNAFTITKSGDASIRPFSPFRASGAYSPALHGGSAYFDGTGDYLDLTGSTGLAFGTGDWTIEFWIYFASLGGDRIIYDSRPAGTNGAYPTIYYQNSTTAFVYYANTGDRIVSSTVVAGTWYPCCCSKNVWNNSHVR
jgi:hypothetical protein